MNVDLFFFLSPASKNQRPQLPIQRGDTCHGPRQQQQPLLPRIPWNFPAPEPQEEGKGTHQEGAGSREGGGGRSTSHEQLRQRGSCILPKVTLPEWQNQTKEPACPAPGWPPPSAAQVGDGHILSVPSPGPRGATVHLECDMWKLITGTHGTKELHFEFCVTGSHLVFKSHLRLLATYKADRSRCPTPLEKQISAHIFLPEVSSVTLGGGRWHISVPPGVTLCRLEVGRG